MFILIYLLGLSLLYLLSREFKVTERLALAMPMGLGLTTFLMFILDRTIHSITGNSVMVAVLFTIAVFIGIRLYLDQKANDLPWKRPRQKIDLSWLTMVWLVFAGMTAYLVYGITIKCLYWPPAEFDTIEGYDLLSKAIAHEHIIVNSILSNKAIVEGCGPRLLYPPLLALANSLCYMTGHDTPKLINAFFYVSWAFIFYLLLRRFVTSANAIIFTFLTIVVPEMFAHGSFSLTNLPCAIYSTIAVASFLIWYEQKKEGFFYLSYLAMIFALWTRSEAIVFIGVILLILLYIAMKEKRYKYLLIYATTVVPFLIWSIFLKAYVPRSQAEFFIRHPFFDGSKMTKVLHTAWELMSRSDLYGVTFYLFIAAVFLNIAVNIALDFKRNKFVLGGLIIWLVIAVAVGVNLFSLILFGALLFAACYVNHDKWALLAIFLLSLAGYTALFYQMSDADGTLFSPGGWMQSGYKRGLFCYAPLALFYVATSKWVNWAFTKLDEQMVLFSRPLKTMEI
jgi:hypothetical protein